MYEIMPFVLIIASLSVIIFIVARKFPMLANLDITTIKAEKETRFKEQIISNRLKRNVADVSNRTSRALKPAWQKIAKSGEWAYKRLGELREEYSAERELTDEDRKSKIDSLFAEAEELERKEEWDEMEKRLIEIIGLESKSIKAFKLLGQAYLEKKTFDDARQTYEHILRLADNEEDDLPLMADQAAAKQRQGELEAEKCLAWDNLSYIAKLEEDWDEALSDIRKALAIEANNPRLLDSLLEISIIKKDKISAQEAYEKLALVNPENQKLDELKGKIAEL